MIRGVGFARDATVTIGGVPVTDFTYFDSSTIRVRTGPHPPGSADVAIASARGDTAVSVGAFVYQDWSRDGGGCRPDEATLCFESGRFSVTASFGEGQPAHALPVAEKSGAFWFTFSPGVEVSVKVLDGRSENGHYWIHLAGLTEQAYDVLVRDTFTFESRRYRHEVGAPQVLIDKESF